MPPGAELGSRSGPEAARDAPGVQKYAFGAPFSRGNGDPRPTNLEKHCDFDAHPMHIRGTSAAHPFNVISGALGRPRSGDVDL